MAANFSLNHPLKTLFSKTLSPAYKVGVVEEYLNTPEKIEQVKQVIPKLKQSLTKKIVDELMQQMENRQYNQVTETILIRYYDPKYSFSLDEIKYDLVIKNDDINQTIIELIKFIS